MLERLKEMGRFIDDMEAVKADIESGDPDLTIHGLERLAGLALDGAEKFRALPGGKRAVDFLRSCARDLLAERQQIIDAQQERVRKVNESIRRSWQRMKRADEARREELRIEAETGEQPDMFGNFTEKGR